MAAGALVGENQLQRIIRDLCEAVIELVKEYRETGEPITDDSTNLHKLSYKLEYLLQFDQKEKTTLLGTRKDYWDFFCDCLAKIKGANDGIRFVKSISELKTSLGKGRAFIRYSLVHQRLADTLQQCLMNQRATSDWYYARSPLLKPHLSVDIISHLYELNEVQFDVASRGHDLDASWPTFSRRTLGTPNSPGHMWKPPSRSSSINSLASTYSQQAHELPSSPDYGQGLLSELDESLASCGDDASAVDNLRLELDQSELRQQGLLSRVQQLGEESGELRRVVAELQRQLDVSLAAQEDHLGLQAALKALEGREQTLSREVETLRSGERAREAEQYLLQDKLAVAEGKNMELLAKLDGVLNEKGLQATSHFDSAQKIHELLDRLKEAESGKMEAVSDMEDKKRQVERLEEEIKVKDEALKEVSNLQRKLEEENQRAQADEETSQQSTLVLKETLETEVNALKELLKIKDMELTSSNQTLQRLESEKDSLTLERDSLVIGNCELETSVKDHTKKIDEYKTQCTSLMELNNKLLSTVKRDEELKKKMVADRVSLVAEVASLTAADKQLRGQLDDTKVAVDEKEKTLRDEIAMAAQVSETTSKRLEQESQALREDRDTMCASLSSIQAELSSSNGQISELEKSLEMSRQNEAGLQEQVRAMEAQLQSKESDFKELQTKVKKMENREKELKKAKAKAEAAFAKQSEVIERLSTEKQAVEESQLEGSSLHAREKQEAVDKLVLVEGQLEVNMKDVSRLQAEVLDLRVQLQRAGEENLKCETKLEVTESQRAEFMSLTEQLQAQTEALNQSHVAELLNCKQKEEVLIEEQARQAAAHAELSASLAAAQQELATLKAENERLVLENGETREGVHRANTEMAELGMTICRLTAEKEEARERWTKEAAKIEELQDGATREVERLEACLAALRQENTSLREGLTQVENLPQAVVELQEQLGKAVGEVQTLQCASKEEMDAVRFQISSESMSHQNQLKSVNEELTTVKAQLHSELETVSRLKGKVSELEAVNEQYQPLMVEKDSHITKCEATLRHNEGEIQQLRDLVSRTEDALSALGTTSEELKERLEKTEAEKQSDHQRMSAEIDDLSVIKSTLEERLIELLRDKDALWQKSDALEFEQKLRAEERWWLVDKEATQCLDCKGHFTWYLRRHHCRLCGHIFCYYCSNNFVVTKHSGKKERCCRECYTQHSDVVERFTQAEVGLAEASPPPAGPGTESHPQPAPYKPTPRVTVSEPGPRAEEGAFDIITEEEVNGVYDSDTVSQTTGGSPESDQGRRPPGPVDIGTGDGAQDDPEDHVTTLQDSEVNLLRSGEVSVAVAHSIDDICHFGDGSRELSIKASCYSLISIAVVDPGPSIGWVFSSEPKSISFSVVYREGPDTPVEQAKVLIPLTRCNSHRETIQGKLKVRHPGLYTLVFDNSFSRFISKKVLYHLTLEKPVVYDGSDFP